MISISLYFLISVWRDRNNFPCRFRFRPHLAADGDAKAEVLTPQAETVLHLDKKAEVSQMPDIVLHPHFPVRGAELNAEDHKKLDELAIGLSGLHVEKIQVTGYTDNVPISEHHRSEYVDNQALSITPRLGGGFSHRPAWAGRALSPEGLSREARKR